MSEIAKYRQSEEAAWNLLDAERQATKRLREQVAAQAVRISELASKDEECDSAWFKIDKLRETIAAQAAVIEKLREALNDQLNDCINFNGGMLTTCIMEASTSALAIPTDSTQVLDEVRRAERERVARVVEVMDGHATSQVLKTIRAME